MGLRARRAGQLHPEPERQLPHTRLQCRRLQGPHPGRSHQTLHYHHHRVRHQGALSDLENNIVKQSQLLQPVLSVPGGLRRLSPHALCNPQTDAHSDWKYIAVMLERACSVCMEPHGDASWVMTPYYDRSSKFHLLTGRCRRLHDPRRPLPVQPRTQHHLHVAVPVGTERRQRGAAPTRLDFHVVASPGHLRHNANRAQCGPLQLGAVCCNSASAAGHTAQLQDSRDPWQRFSGALLPQVRTKGVDIVVGLSHVGYSVDQEVRSCRQARSSCRQACRQPCRQLCHAELGAPDWRHLHIVSTHHADLQCFRPPPCFPKIFRTPAQLTPPTFLNRVVLVASLRRVSDIHGAGDSPGGARLFSFGMVT